MSIIISALDSRRAYLVKLRFDCFKISFSPDGTLLLRAIAATAFYMPSVVIHYVQLVT